MSELLIVAKVMIKYDPLRLWPINNGFTLWPSQLLFCKCHECYRLKKHYCNSSTVGVFLKTLCNMQHYSFYSFPIFMATPAPGSLPNNSGSKSHPYRDCSHARPNQNQRIYNLVHLPGFPIRFYR